MKHKDYHLTAPEIAKAIHLSILPLPKCTLHTLTQTSGNTVLEIKTYNPTVEIVASKKRTNIYTTKYSIDIKNPDGVLQTVGQSESNFSASDAYAIFDALYSYAWKSVRDAR